MLSSWSRLVSLPIWLRNVMILLASCGPMPLTVCNCCSFAVLRLTLPSTQMPVAHESAGCKEGACEEGANEGACEEDDGELDDGEEDCCESDCAEEAAEELLPEPEFAEESVPAPGELS